MTIAPIIERELRLALRKKNSIKSRFIYAAIGVGLAILCLIIQAVTWNRNAVVVLHAWMFYLGLYVAFFKTQELTADLFVEERRSETMGLLYLAGVSMQELFGGKLLAAFLVSSTNLLALAPCMAIPFLTGGISVSVFLATIFCLPAVLVFTLSVVCLSSVVWKEESTARVGSMVITAILSLVPVGAYEFCAASSNPISPLWRVLSPAWGPWLIIKEYLAVSHNEFWLNLAITLGWSLLFFAGAGLLMREFWKREVSGKAGRGWLDRMLKWMVGSLDWRQKQRRWLDINPFVYRALSDRQPVRLAWSVVALIVAITLLCCWIMPKEWLKVWIFYAAAIAMLISIEWIVGFTAAKRVADDRRNGNYELLLTTPMGIHEILDGQVNALDLQFRPIFVGICVTNVGMMIAGFFIRSWTWSSTAVYVMTWLSIILFTSRHCWTKRFYAFKSQMWAGLNTGLPSFAMTKCWGINKSAFINAWFLGGILLKGADFPTGSNLELVVVVSVAMFASATFFAGLLSDDSVFHFEDMLLKDFRLIAAEPLPDPKDPRLKNWKPQERLYHHRKQLLDPTSAIPK